ncbi:unnamed protein product [Mesocestoides corti]|uniref:PDZ domain-containing protein n=1 Tax=Mesocestoides corti TaxID=53468 RepID=A0A158QVY4_MESCO|nr:unnamed protein product [Mesocestoides corti]
MAKLHLSTVELRRPDSSHSWGFYYAVLPGGPEVLKVLSESPAYGHIRNGQVIKTINGQSILGLKREDITELLNIDEEVVVLEVTESEPIDKKSLLFAREYGRGSVEPRQLTRRRNSEMPAVPERRGSNVCVAMPTNLPNCREEFERIHLQRKQSRELTFNQLENRRLQRAASIEPNWETRPQMPPGLPPKPANPTPGLDTLAETPNQEDKMAGLRYMGVQIPSRSFKALASLMGMDPSGSDVDSQNIQATSTEPCRTVIDVRAAAEAMRKDSVRRSSVDSNASSNYSLPPHAPPPPPPSATNHSVSAT